MLDKFEKFNNRLSSWFEWIGVAGLLLMMVVTLIDVIGNKVFNSPLLGAIDWVRVFQSVAIAFACAVTLIIGRHIQVEFIVNRFPKRAQSVIGSCVFFLVLILFVLLVWRLIDFGITLQITGEESATAHIPRCLPAYGIALASIPVCLVLLQKFLKSLTKADKK